MSEPAVDLVARAELLLQAKRHAEASALLGRVVAMDPGDADAWCHLARARLSQDDLAGALEAAGAAVRAQPSSEWAHRLVSVVLQRQGRTGEAVTAAREAVRLNPDGGRTHRQLSQALVAEIQRRRRWGWRTKELRGLLHEASAAAEEAARLEPRSADAHIQRGVVADVTADRDREVAAYQQALRVDPQNSVARNNLALVAMQDRRYEPAARHLAAALRTDPGWPAPRQNAELLLNWILRRLFLQAFLAVLVVGLAHVSIEERPYPVHAAFGVLLAGGAAWYVRHLLQQTPPALRSYLRDRLPRSPALLVPAVLALAWTMLGVVRAFVPFDNWGALAVPGYAILGSSFAYVAVFAFTGGRRQQD